MFGFVIHSKVVSGQDFVVPQEFQYHSRKRWETLFGWNLLFQLDGTFVDLTSVTSNGQTREEMCC